MCSTRQLKAELKNIHYRERDEQMNAIRRQRLDDLRVIMAEQDAAHCPNPQCEWVDAAGQLKYGPQHERVFERHVGFSGSRSTLKHQQEEDAQMQWAACQLWKEAYIQPSLYERCGRTHAWYGIKRCSEGSLLQN